MKNNVDKLGFHKLLPIPFDLSKLSNVGKSDLVKKTEYDKFVKRVNAVKTTDTNLVKKLAITQKSMKSKNDQDHSNKYITTQELDKLMSGNFTSRLAKANLASINDVDNFTKKADFDDKLKTKINTKVTSNKTKHVEAEKKITDLTNKVATISEEGYDFLLGKCIL